MRINPMYHHTPDRLKEELSWIQKAKDDPRFFAPLYEKYHEAIFRYVYQRMDDQELARDVTSQVFMKAMKNLSKYEYRGVPFGSWLFRIAKSELYQAFRDKKAERTVNVETVILYEMMEEMEENHSERNTRVLFKSLAGLKEESLQIIEMRFFEKRSFKEIGEILEITENNAKVKCFRILNRMKKDFAEK